MAAKVLKLKVKKPALRTILNKKVLLEVDRMVFSAREARPLRHVKGEPYAAEWLSALSRHPKTRHLFREDVGTI